MGDGYRSLVPANGKEIRWIMDEEKGIISEAWSEKEEEKGQKPEIMTAQIGDRGKGMHERRKISPPPLIDLLFKAIGFQQLEEIVKIDIGSPF